jgi:hypothetical protein
MLNPGSLRDSYPRFCLQNIVKEGLTRKIFRNKDLRHQISEFQGFQVKLGLACLENLLAAELAWLFSSPVDCGATGARFHCEPSISSVKVVRHKELNISWGKVSGAFSSERENGCRPWGTLADFLLCPGLTSWARLFRRFAAEVYFCSLLCCGSRRVTTKLQITSFALKSWLVLPIVFSGSYCSPPGQVFPAPFTL